MPETTPEPPAKPDDDAPGLPGSTNIPDSAGGQPPEDPTVRKALEQAQREQQIQQSIDKHEFFVPVNAEARKRNIKTSFELVFLEFLLGIVLINLMLDAGVIELLDKIPHTNFFGPD